MSVAVAEETRRLAGAWTAVPARPEGWRVGDKVYVGRARLTVGVVWGNGDCWAADPRDLSKDMVARIHQKRALEEEASCSRPSGAPMRSSWRSCANSPNERRNDEYRSQLGAT